MRIGEPPSRVMVSRLLGRALSLAVAVFATVGVITFIVEFVRRHDDSSELFPFGGWQVDLALLAVALIGLAAFVAGVLGMRRYRPSRDTPRSYQVLAAFIAIMLGISVSQAFRHEPERAYNWAAGYTTGAAREKAQDAAVVRQMLGDATHPPQPFGPDGVVQFPTAPGFVAAPLLRAGDLGVDWYSQGPARGEYTDPDQPGGAAGIRSSGQVNLAQEAWNGRRWVQNMGLLEVARRFFTAREARTYTREQVQDSRLSTPASPAPTRWRVDGVTVWHDHSATSDRAYLTVGSTAVLIDVVPTPPTSPETTLGSTPTFPTVTDLQIVAAAIKRAGQAT